MTGHLIIDNVLNEDQYWVVDYTDTFASALTVFFEMVSK